jgi:hypothetical protein
MVAQLVAALFQRFHGAFHGRFAEAPGYRHALAEPDDARKAIENAKSMFVWAGDQ